MNTQASEPHSSGASQVYTPTSITVDDLYGSATELTRKLVDISSVSQQEKNLADQLEAVFSAVAEQSDHIHVHRMGNSLVLQTHRGLPERIILAGHIDTVPEADNVPSSLKHIDGQDVIAGLGSVDMKSGDAAYIHTFVTLADSPLLQWDMTLILYEGEEVATQYNGLGHIAAQAPELLSGSLALLGEPSSAQVEAGCQGTLRVKVTALGQRAHSARSWLGENAIHKLAEVIQSIAEFGNPEVTVDECTYREGMNAVMGEAGVATNTIPDQAWIFVNYRFAPDKTIQQAMHILLDTLGIELGEEAEQLYSLETSEMHSPKGFVLEVDDAASAARPGLDKPLAQSLVAATGTPARAKYGWTDVARFSELGIPALNFGPGDPSLCHTPQENCPVWMIESVTQQLHDFLTTPLALQ